MAFFQRLKQSASGQNSPRSESPKLLMSTAAHPGAIVQSSAKKVSGASPFPRSGAAIVQSHDGKDIVVIGGLDTNKKPLNDVTILSTSGLSSFNQVTCTGTPPSPRCFHGAARIGKRIYVFGGIDASRSHDNGLYSFSLDTKAWSRPRLGKTIPEGRHGVSLTAVEDKIYMFGGLTDDGYSNELWVLEEVNSPNPTWSLVEVADPLPAGRAHHSMVVCGNGHQLILFGGECGFEVMDDIWVFDIRKHRWHQVQEQEPSARYNHGSLVLNSAMLIFGGVDYQGKVLNDIWSFEIKSGEWRNLGLLPHSRSGDCPIAVSNKVFLLGGHGDDEKDVLPIVQFEQTKLKHKKGAMPSPPRSPRTFSNPTSSLKKSDIVYFNDAIPPPTSLPPCPPSINFPPPPNADPFKSLDESFKKVSCLGESPKMTEAPKPPAPLPPVLDSPVSFPFHESMKFKEMPPKPTKSADQTEVIRNLSEALASVKKEKKALEEKLGALDSLALILGEEFNVPDVGPENAFEATIMLLKRFRTEISTKENELGILKKEVAVSSLSHEKKLLALEKEKLDAEMELHKTKSMFTFAEQKLNDKNSVSENFKSQLEQAKQQNAAIVAELSDLKEMHLRVNVEKQALLKDLESSREERNGNLARQKELIAERDNLLEQINFLRQNASAAAEISSKEECSRLLAELEQARSETSKMQSLQLKLQRTEDLYEKIKAENEELLHKVNAAEKRIRDLENSSEQEAVLPSASTIPAPPPPPPPPALTSTETSSGVVPIPPPPPLPQASADMIQTRSSTPGGLLAEIQAGKKLKHVEETPEKSPVSISPKANDPMAAMLAEMQKKKLKNASRQNSSSSNSVSVDAELLEKLKNRKV